MSVIIFLNIYSYSMFFIDSIKNIYNSFNHESLWTSRCYKFWQDNTSKITNNIVTNFPTKIPFLKKYFAFYKPKVKNTINETSVTTEDSANNKLEPVLQNFNQQEIENLTFYDVITLRSNGNNLLHQAAFNNNVEFIEKILQENLADYKKASVIMEQPNNVSDTLLDIAYKQKNYSIIFKVAEILDNNNTSQDCTIPDGYKHMTQAEYDIGVFLNRKSSHPQEPIDITKLWMPVEYELYYKMYQDINFTIVPEITDQFIIGDTLKE
jgi:hypothetical protein